jgi:hypothetical protein
MTMDCLAAFETRKVNNDLGLHTEILREVGKLWAMKAAAGFEVNRKSEDDLVVYNGKFYRVNAEPVNDDGYCAVIFEEVTDFIS